MDRFNFRLKASPRGLPRILLVLWFPIWLICLAIYFVIWLIVKAIKFVIWIFSPVKERPKREKTKGGGENVRK